MPSKTHRLRPATAADQQFLDALYFEAHRDEFLPLQLPEAQLQALLDMQARAQRLGYARDFPHAKDQIVYGEDGELFGRMLVDETCERVHLVDVALVRRAQGQGVGTALLRDLIAACERRNLPLRLQVRPGNRAFQLYSRLGFVLTGGGVQLEMEYRPGGLPAQKTPAPVDDPASSWEPARGCPFVIGMEPPVELVLDRVVRYPGSRAFALYFHGSTERPLGQGTYPLQGTDRQEEWLFLVPVDRLGQTLEYEAVFNS